MYNYNHYGITSYRLLDDTYNDTKEKIDIILDIVKELPFKPLFWSYLRLDLMAKHPETIDKIVQTGIRQMFFGLETLNKQAGAAVGKGYDPDAQVETIRYIKKTYGDSVYLFGSFICGLPYESKESVLNTMQRLQTKDIPLDGSYYSPLLIMKKDYQTWESAFGIDMTKFGYKEMPNTREVYREEVLWQNDFMNIFESKAMCKMYAEKNAHSTFKITPSECDIITCYKICLWKHLEKINNAI